MRKRNFKGRCEKRSVPKCIEICRTYDAIQSAFADALAMDDEVVEFRCNVYLDGLSLGDYTTDFVCTKTDGTIMVRECVWRSKLSKPLTYNLLEASRNYWRNHGVIDWGIVVNEKEYLSQFFFTS